MSKFKTARVFKNAVEQLPKQPPRHITGVTFDDKGESCLTAAEDESYRLYSCKSGKLLKTFYSKKYGVDLPRFTHNRQSIIYASTKEDDTIRHASLHDNRYLQYFKGHQERVTSLEMSPVDDTFISASADHTVRLWDTRTPNCRGLLHTPSLPVVAYDVSGAVFAIALNQFSRILLYDHNNFDQEPFLTMELHDAVLERATFPPIPPFITSLAFSSHGKYILVGTSGGSHYIMDAFDGSMLLKLVMGDHIPMERGKSPIQTLLPRKGVSGEEVTWTPDAKYVLGGSLDGKVLIWDVSDPNMMQSVSKGQEIPRIEPAAVLDGQHPGPTRCVRFNPKCAMMATAGTELAFWIPDLNGGDTDADAKKLLAKMG